jgi:predicted ArsR family transcriptional regulator
MFSFLQGLLFKNANDIKRYKDLIVIKCRKLLMGGNDAPKAIGLGDTKGKIMELLLDKPRSSAEIAGMLKIQKSAARVHLESLQAEHIVKSSFKIERLGRPRKVYELTEYGKELFPRKYDLILNHVLKTIAEQEGKERARKIIESVSDSLAADIRDRIERSGNSGDFEGSLKVLNSISNELGFASVLSEEGGGGAAAGDGPATAASHDNNEGAKAYSILSRNCILYRVAMENQDAICHGLHDMVIRKSLDGKSDVNVELRECMALGDAYCRHVITNKKSEKEV